MKKITYQCDYCGNDVHEERTENNYPKPYIKIFSSRIFISTLMGWDSIDVKDCYFCSFKHYRLYVLEEIEKRRKYMSASRETQREVNIENL